MIGSRGSFGHDVLGPITGEFCLRLWSFGSLLDQPDDAAMLFCARGGLRLQLAYERFLATSNLQPPTTLSALMVSRLVAIKPAIARIAETGSLSLSAASALAYEFSDRSLPEVIRALSGCEASEDWSQPQAFTPAELTRFLLSPAGSTAFEAIRNQANLFERHLRLKLDGRRHAILVDTGLFGTTLQLLDDGIPDLQFSSALIARTLYGGRRLEPRQERKVVGLSVETFGYSPLRRRSAILRYWHLIESTFEPDLPSVRSFSEHDGVPVSNLEISGWKDRLAPASPDTIFAGVMRYLETRPAGDALAILADTDRAWHEFHKAVVWPNAEQAITLEVGVRGTDFGINGERTSTRPWRGPLQALRGRALWREGDIARSKTRLRLLLLTLIEAAYGLRVARQAWRRLRKRLPR